MRRSPLLSVFILALATAASAQLAPEAPITATASKAPERFPLAPSGPAATAPEQPATVARPRALSPETAAKISATSPKFTPPKPAEVKTEELPDLREIDKPRNGIIRLPQVMVQEQKLPTLKDRELLTLYGKLDLAYKRHPGLHFGSSVLPSNNGVALVMLEEERRLERMSEMSEIIGLYQYSDPKTGAALKTQSTTIFLRSGEWVEGRGGPGGGHAISKLQ